MYENVLSKGSETIFTNKAFSMLTGLQHYKLLDTEMYDGSVSVKVSSKLSYAKAISDGIQGAVQIADRFHLVSNCGDNIMKQIRHDFLNIRKEIAGDAYDGAGIVRYRPTERQFDRYHTMAVLSKKGVSNKMIADLLGTEGKQLKEIWQDLWNDGLEMNYITLLRHMHKVYPEYKSHKGIRAGEKVDNRKALKVLASRGSVCTARSVDVLHLGKMHIYVCNPDYGVDRKSGECTKDNILYNQAIAKSQTLTELREAMVSFRVVLKGKNTDSLDEWIKKYSASKYNRIANFATHFLDDISAVRNAVCFDYSNGIAEGFNNKIKAIKREMYGRAKKDLLEKKLIASVLT